MRGRGGPKDPRQRRGRSTGVDSFGPRPPYPPPHMDLPSHPPSHMDHAAPPPFPLDDPFHMHGPPPPEMFGPGPPLRGMMMPLLHPHDMPFVGMPPPMMDPFMMPPGGRGGELGPSISLIEAVKTLEWDALRWYMRDREGARQVLLEAVSACRLSVVEAVFNAYGPLILSYTNHEAMRAALAAPLLKTSLPSDQRGLIKFLYTKTRGEPPKGLLHICVTNDVHPSVFDLLVQCGADVNETNNSGQPLLFHVLGLLSSGVEDTTAVKWATKLLEHGVDLEVHDGSPQQLSALMKVLKLWRGEANVAVVCDLVNKLCEANPQLLTMHDAYRTTALAYACRLTRTDYLDLEELVNMVDTPAIKHHVSGRIKTLGWGKHTPTPSPYAHADDLLVKRVIDLMFEVAAGCGSNDKPIVDLAATVGGPNDAFNLAPVHYALMGKNRDPEALLALMPRVTKEQVPKDAFLTAAWWGNIELIKHMNTTLRVEPMLLSDLGRNDLDGVLYLKEGVLPHRATLPKTGLPQKSNSNLPPGKPILSRSNSTLPLWAVNRSLDIGAVLKDADEKLRSSKPPMMENPDMQRQHGRALEKAKRLRTKGDHNKSSAHARHTHSFLAPDGASGGPLTPIPSPASTLTAAATSYATIKHGESAGPRDPRLLRVNDSSEPTTAATSAATAPTATAMDVLTQQLPPAFDASSALAQSGGDPSMVQNFMVNRAQEVRKETEEMKKDVEALRAQLTQMDEDEQKANAEYSKQQHELQIVQQWLDNTKDQGAAAIQEKADAEARLASLQQELKSAREGAAKLASTRKAEAAVKLREVEDELRELRLAVAKAQQLLNAEKSRNQTRNKDVDDAIRARQKAADEAEVLREELSVVEETKRVAEEKHQKLREDLRQQKDRLDQWTDDKHNGKADALTTEKVLLDRLRGLSEKHQCAKTYGDLIDETFALEAEKRVRVKAEKLRQLQTLRAKVADVQSRRDEAGLKEVEACRARLRKLREVDLVDAVKGKEDAETALKEAQDRESQAERQLIEAKADAEARDREGRTKQIQEGGSEDASACRDRSDQATEQANAIRAQLEERKQAKSWDEEKRRRQTGDAGAESTRGEAEVDAATTECLQREGVEGKGEDGVGAPHQPQQLPQPVAPELQQPQQEAHMDMHVQQVIDLVDDSDDE